MPSTSTIIEAYFELMERIAPGNERVPADHPRRDEYESAVKQTRALIDLEKRDAAEREAQQERDLAELDRQLRPVTDVLRDTS